MCRLEKAKLAKACLETAKELYRLGGEHVLYAIALEQDAHLLAQEATQ
jgi:hypothetical protein